MLINILILLNNNKNITTDSEFAQALSQNNIMIDDYKNYLNEQFRWLAYIKQEFYKNNPITDEMVENEVVILTNNEGKNIYDISEIKILFTPESKNNALSVVRNLMNNFTKGLNFYNFVDEMKDKTGLIETSHLGWVIGNQYEYFDIDNMVKKFPSQNNIIGPIETLGSFIVLHINNQDTISISDAVIDRSMIKERLEKRAEQFLAKRLLGQARQQSLIELR